MPDREVTRVEVLSELQTRCIEATVNVNYAQVVRNDVEGLTGCIRAPTLIVWVSSTRSPRGIADLPRGRYSDKGHRPYTSLAGQSPAPRLRLKRNNLLRLSS